MLGPSYQYKATVTGVIDGDTLDVSVDLGFRISVSHRVRLARINTPEINSKDLAERQKAQEAKQYVSQLLGQPVVIQSIKDDKYGRWLAEVWYLDQGVQVNLNDSLLVSGLATLYS